MMTPIALIYENLINTTHMKRALDIDQLSFFCDSRTIQGIDIRSSCTRLWRSQSLQ